MGSVGVSAGRDIRDLSRPDQSGRVVVKWLGAGVVQAGNGQMVLGDSKGAANGDVISDAGRDADAPRRLTIRAAVGSEDRKGDVIDANGWELDGYRRNPVFLWAHDRSRPPIGKSQRIWVEDGALYAEVEFAPTDFAGEIAGLYERWFMRGVSVGFLPLETEIRKASNGRRGYLYRRQEFVGDQRRSRCRCMTGPYLTPLRAARGTRASEASTQGVPRVASTQFQTLPSVGEARVRRQVWGDAAGFAEVAGSCSEELVD